MIHLSILLALCSLLFFHRQNTRLAVGILFLAALVLRYHYITLDAFLHDWDERFHALVAKNMMTEPFKPMLRTTPYNELLLYILAR